MTERGPVDGAMRRCSPIERPWSPASGRLANSVRPRAGESVTACTLEGHWAHADVHVQCPGTWATAGVLVELWARVEGVESLASRVDLRFAAVQARGGGQLVGRVAGVRGRPGERYEVRIVSSSVAGALEPGWVALEAWGVEAGASHALGELPRDGAVPLDAAPPVEGFGMLWSPGSSSWQRARVAVAPVVASAPVLVCGGAAQPVVGASTPCVAVLVQADKGNAGTLCLGGAGVTAATGIELAAGEMLVVGADDAHKLYAIAGPAGGAPKLRALLLS